MRDGPACFAFDKFHGHSKLLYAHPEVKLDHHSFGKLWSNAKRF